MATRHILLTSSSAGWGNRINTLQRYKSHPTTGQAGYDFSVSFCILCKVFTILHQEERMYDCDMPDLKGFDYEIHVSISNDHKQWGVAERHRKLPEVQYKSVW